MIGQQVGSCFYIGSDSEIPDCDWMTEQCLTNSDKSGKLEYVSTTPWNAKGPFSFVLLQSSKQALSNPLRPLLVPSLMCVCSDLLTREREDR